MGAFIVPAWVQGRREKYFWQVEFNTINCVLVQSLETQRSGLLSGPLEGFLGTGELNR